MQALLERDHSRSRDICGATDAEAARAMRGVLPDERIRRRSDLSLDDPVETKLVDAVADDARIPRIGSRTVLLAS